MLTNLRSYILQNNVFRNFLIYFIGAVCLRGFAIFLAPINMRILTPHDYGVLALINNIISIGVIILGFGLRQFLSIEYFHHDEPGKQHLIARLVSVYISISLPICVIILIAQPYFTYWLALHSVSPLVLSIIMLTIFLSFFSELFYQILKYRAQAHLLTFIQMCIALWSIAITLILLWHYKLGVMSNVIGQLAGVTAAAMIGFIAFGRIIAFENLKKPRRNELIYFLKQSLPFMPGILLSWIIASADRLILAQYAGMAEVGIYAIADMFGQLFQFLVLQSWSAAYLPYILMRYHENKENMLAIEEKNLKTMWITLSALALAMIAGYLIFKPLILLILPTNYHEALNYTAILLAGYLFLLGSYFAASFIQFHKKKYFLAVSFCMPALLNIILNFLLVPHYKIYGASYATLSAYAVYFCIILWYNRKLRRALCTAKKYS